MYPTPMQPTSGQVRAVDPSPVDAQGRLAGGTPNAAAGATTVIPGANAGSGTATPVAGDPPLTDTAGTVQVNPAGAPAAGSLFTVTFAQPFARRPVVIVEQQDSGNTFGGTTNVVFARSGALYTGFGLYSATATTAGQMYRFGYVVVPVAE